MSSLIGLSKRLAIFLLIPLLLSACVDGGSRPGGYYPPERPRPDWNQPGRPDRPDRPGRPGRPEQPGVCTREYRPVCGQQGGRTQTFPNACEAANAGFSVVASGECRR